MDTFRQLLPLVLQVSLVLAVFCVGLQARAPDFLYALRHPVQLLRGIAAVNLIVPATAVALVLLFPLSPPVTAAIVLMSVAPLAPLVPGKMLKAGSRPSFAVGLYVALMLLAIAIVPLSLALLSLVFPADAAVEPASVARLVVTSVLLPLAAGVALGALAPRLAGSAAPIVLIVSNVGLLLFLVPVVVAMGQQMLALIGNGTIAIIAATVAAGLAGGHLLGGPHRSDRTALALAAATRHPGLALMIARENFDDPRIAPAVLLFMLTGMVVSAAYQRLAGRGRAQGATVAGSALR